MSAEQVQAKASETNELRNETAAELKAIEAEATAANRKLWLGEADELTLPADKPAPIDSALLAALKADDDEARAKTQALIEKTARELAERKAAREAQRALELSRAKRRDARENKQGWHPISKRFIKKLAKGGKMYQQPPFIKKAKPGVKECAVWHVGKNWHVAVDKTSKTYRVAASKLEGMRIALKMGYTHCQGANYDGKVASMARWAHFRVPAKK